MPTATRAGRAAALAYAARHARRFVSELAEFVRFPSVSADPRHAADVRRCAAWLAAHLRAVGLDRVAVLRTPGHPIVAAEWRGAGSAAPTVLVYGHYDVQPADGREGWTTPPFEPVVRGGALHGRGASDDKGQLLAHVKAIEAYLRTGGAPANVVCLFEGEEEVGGEQLLRLLRRTAAGPAPAFGADVAVVSDTVMRGRGRPAVTHAVRGQLALELTALGADADLHSGNFGGAVPNALEALSAVVASLHDASGRVAVEGFYDRVRAVPDAERAYMARAGPGDAELLRDAGARRGRGEPGFSLYERIAVRPALTVNGVAGGYAGAGAKAVIPARATAKVSVRLVPDQEPAEIGRLIRRHVARVTPPGVRVRVEMGASAPPAVLPREHPAVRAAAAACARAYGAEPVVLRSGGTIPVVAELQHGLGVPTVLMGFALPDDGLHGPDEKFELDNFARAVAACVHFLAEVAR